MPCNYRTAPGTLSSIPAFAAISVIGDIVVSCAISISVLNPIENSPFPQRNTFPLRMGSLCPFYLYHMIKTVQFQYLILFSYTIHCKFCCCFTIPELNSCLSIRLLQIFQNRNKDIADNNEILRMKSGRKIIAEQNLGRRGKFFVPFPQEETVQSSPEILPPDMPHPPPLPALHA